MSDRPTLPGLYRQCWQLLQEAVATDRSPLRFVTFATLGLDGAPQARTVVLRHICQTDATVAAYTDMRSTKVAELRKTPLAAVHLWAPDALVQLRLNGTAQITRGAAQDWDAIPHMMREAYGHVPPPATPISASDDWQVRPEPGNFARIALVLDRIDFVSLDPAGHHRARFDRAAGWQGEWVSP